MSDINTTSLSAFRGSNKGMHYETRCGGLIKVLWHDGQGMCLFAKRLERGRFIWPSPSDGTVTITPAQLGYLLEGIDWRMPQQTWRPQAAG
jgi:transposase